MSFENAPISEGIEAKERKEADLQKEKLNAEIDAMRVEIDEIKLYDNVEGGETGVIDGTRRVAEDGEPNSVIDGTRRLTAIPEAGVIDGTRRITATPEAGVIDGTRR